MGDREAVPRRDGGSQQILVPDLPVKRAPTTVHEFAPHSPGLRPVLGLDRVVGTQVQVRFDLSVVRGVTSALEQLHDNHVGDPDQAGHEADSELRDYAASSAATSFVSGRHAPSRTMA